MNSITALVYSLLVGKVKQLHSGNKCLSSLLQTHNRGDLRRAEEDLEKYNSSTPVNGITTLYYQ